VSIFGLGCCQRVLLIALRRAANAIINITWTAQLPINLYQMLEQITVDFAAATKAEELSHSYGNSSCNESDQLQEERLIDYDLVNAVLGKMIQNMGYGR